MLPKVFERFSRSLRTRESGLPGLGKGSRFTVFLPLIRGPSPLPTLPRPEPAGVARRVLVVDDNVDAAESVEMMLSMLGHQTQVAHDGLSAIAAVGEYQPDFALLDIGMPGMDGYQVASELRKDPSHARTVLVALTGWGSEEDKRKTKAAGFALHLTKPIDLPAMERVLKTSLPRAD